MTRRRATPVAWALVVLALAGTRAEARTQRVPARVGAAQAALAAAAAGDTVLLAPGVHAGPLVVTRALTLRGEPGAVVDGGGEGTVIAVSAAGTVIEDLAVRGSGRHVLTIDAGLRVIGAGGVSVRRVRLSGVLYGVYAERAPGLEVSDCTLTGQVTAGHGESQGDGEGNGIHLWYTPDARLARNDVSRFQDAIYLSFANGAHAAGNHLHDCGRYGFHTMYCQAGELTGNVFEHNVAGCAVMFSNHLLVKANDFIHNRGSRTYGLLLRDCSDGCFEGNRLVDDTVGMFLDDSNRNRFAGNLVQDDGWGVLLYSSCAGNVFTANSFVNDDYPVALDMRFTSNRFDDGCTGNYWSDNAAYDLNADGVSDGPYSPVGTFSFLSKQYPDLSVLAKSPAVAALTVADQVLPALRPSEAVDRFPLVNPPRGTPAVMPRAAAKRAPAPAASPAPIGTRWGAVAFASLAVASLAGLAGTRGRS